VVVDMKDYSQTKLCDYVSGQDVIFKAEKDSVYQLLALISNDNITDLTPDAVISASCYADKNNGLIELR
jgi:hypothetical protein